MVSQYAIVFEYGAILKGSQTTTVILKLCRAFEYGAILKGSQTQKIGYRLSKRFEYGAILKGSQTGVKSTSNLRSLSMVQF